MVTPGVIIPTTSALGLLVDLATRMRDHEVEVTSDAANRVSGEEAYRLWQFRGARIAGSLSDPWLAATVFRETLRFARRRGSSFGVEPVLLAALNGAWPVMSLHETQLALSSVQELIDKSAFARSAPFAVFDPLNRTISLTTVEALRRIDLNAWIDWRKVIDEQYRTPIPALPNGQIPGARQDYGLGRIPGQPGGGRGEDIWGGLGGGRGGYGPGYGGYGGGPGPGWGSSGWGPTGVGPGAGGGWLPEGFGPGGKWGGGGPGMGPGGPAGWGPGNPGWGGMPGGPGPGSWGPWGNGPLGGYWGAGSHGPFGPGVLPNPGGVMSEGEGWRIAGDVVIAYGGLAGAGGLMVVGASPFSGIALVGIGLIAVAAGSALKEHGQDLKEQAEKDRADKDKGATSTGVVVPTPVTDDEEEGEVIDLDEDETEKEKKKGRPNPFDMPNPDDPNGGGPAAHRGDYYPAPDTDGGGGPSWRELYYPNPDDVGPGGPAGVWAARGSSKPTQGISVTLHTLTGAGLAAPMTQIGDRVFAY